MKRILFLTCLLLSVLTLFATDNKVVKYSDFGAKGDGKSDDFDALIAAHNYANEHKLPVKADDGAIYYLSGDDKTITIKTDTDWGKAQIIIDDSKVINRNNIVFRVESFSKPIEFTNIPSIKAGQETLELNLKQDAFIFLRNNTERHYIRYGINASKGDLKTDVFIVDKDNKVHPDSPILWDFTKITTLRAYPIDKEQLVLKGGIFTTIANQGENLLHHYHKRGIVINRSNTLIYGLTHYVKGELKEHGQPYSGFLQTENCAEITFENCTFTAHKRYFAKNANGQNIPMGSYDFNISYAVNVNLINCIQTNSLIDSEFWAIMASNYAKNLKYENCKLSRFDAHRGVFNATILNSEIGYGGINLIGSGTFRIENSTVNASTLLRCRADYGGTWDGDIIVRNCKFIPLKENNKPFNPNLIFLMNYGEHDFGYTCYAPHNIDIDGLIVTDSTAANSSGPRLFSNFNPKYTTDNFKQKFPYIIDTKINIRNLKLEGTNKTLKICDNPYMLKYLENPQINYAK